MDNKRAEKILDAARIKGCDCAIIMLDKNLYYFSGFTGDSGMLLIAEGKRMLLTDFRYIEQANKQAEGYEIHEFLRGSQYSLLSELIAKNGYKFAAYEGNIRLDEYEQLNNSAPVHARINDDIDNLRAIKDSYEIEQIEKAASLCDDGFKHIIGYIKPGVTELEIALELEFFIRKNGATGMSFSSIIASGKNGSLPHAKPTDKKIEKGELITIDFGCMINGYCCDMTRTIAISEVAKSLENIYNICLDAQCAAVAGLKAGLKASFVDAIARDFISEKGFGECFGHGLGHGVGLNIHESPRLTPQCDTVLEKNMIVTVEPGIYIPNLGGVRIEDLCIVEENGCRILSHSPKQLITIG